MGALLDLAVIAVVLGPFIVGITRGNRRERTLRELRDRWTDAQIAKRRWE